MVFVTTGLGGGTGTGAAPIVASLASELGALTVAVVTKPFFEGKRRQMQAEHGLAELSESVDTSSPFPTSGCCRSPRTPDCSTRSALADDILRQAMQGISDIIVIPGIINLDFADVKTIMRGMGYAVMGTAMASGAKPRRRGRHARHLAPLLEDASINGARGILINITGWPASLRLAGHDASSIIQQAAHEDANIIFGAVLDESMKDEVKITVIATGFKDVSRRRERSNPAAEVVQHARATAASVHATYEVPAMHEPQPAPEKAVPSRFEAVKPSEAESPRPRNGRARFLTFPTISTTLIPRSSATPSR